MTTTLSLNSTTDAYYASILERPSVNSAVGNAWLTIIAAQIDAGGSAGFIKLGIGNPQISSVTTVTMQLAYPCATTVGNLTTFADIPQGVATVGGTISYLQLTDSSGNVVITSQSVTLQHNAVQIGQPIKLNSVLMHMAGCRPTQAPQAANPYFPRSWSISLPTNLAQPIKDRILPISLEFPVAFQAISPYVIGGGTYHFGDYAVYTTALVPWVKVYSFSHTNSQGQSLSPYQHTLTLTCDYDSDATHLIVRAETTSPWVKMSQTGDTPSGTSAGPCTLSIGFEKTDYWNSTLANAFTPTITATLPSSSYNCPVLNFSDITTSQNYPGIPLGSLSPTYQQFQRNWTFNSDNI